MKLAVMQPYLFPYIGYFQLIYAADLFLIYDDIAYIKQGYINKNSILSTNGAIRFTVPVPGASSNKLISELQYSDRVKKILKTIEQSYSKAPLFEFVFPILRRSLEHKDRSIATVCQKSYEEIFSYLGIEKRFAKTSELDYDRYASAQDRLVALCHLFGADCYLNSPGGRKLYTKSDFAKKGVDLKFVDSLPVEYSQGGTGFTPNLSIIDMLMNCSPQQVIEQMERYEFG
ncbi:WbqC family protein [Billgrantia bachuensis]|uniref:WbqC family protein n=1 Tax=Billgrantia bachuensis TaxID=2717286 RepID=A0ABX0PQ53_9GAMM|nr:WbqC family protein [Halomonas bachuensis]NIC04298.1 WbqC family protein [Halomonas bachuensis]